MKTLVDHHRDHDVIAHQLDDDERHAAAEFIGGYLLPRVAEGWSHATDADLAYEIRRLAGQERSELNTALINLVTDEQARRALTTTGASA